MNDRMVGCAHRSLLRLPGCHCWLAQQCRVVVLCSIAACFFAPGCAGWKAKVQKPTLTDKREDRTAEAVRDFEERRDAAQLEAALDRWKHGDVATAEAMLAAI